jgi:hypothetical protein
VNSNISGTQLCELNEQQVLVWDIVFRCRPQWKCGVNVHWDMERTRTYLKTYNHVQFNGFMYNLFSYCNHHSITITNILKTSVWNASFAFPGICLCFLRRSVPRRTEIGRESGEWEIDFSRNIYIIFLWLTILKNAACLATTFFFRSHFEVEN